MGYAHDGVEAAERGDAAPEALAAREKQGMLAGTPSDFQQVASGLGTDEQTRQLAMKMGYTAEKVSNTPIAELKRELIIRFGGTTQEGEEQDNIITEAEKAAGMSGVTQAEKDLGLKTQGTIFPMGGNPTPYSGGKTRMVPQLPGGGVAAAGLVGAPSLYPNLQQQMQQPRHDPVTGLPTTFMEVPFPGMESYMSGHPDPQPYGTTFDIKPDPATTNYARPESTKRRRQFSKSEPYVPSSATMKNEILRAKVEEKKRALMKLKEQEEEEDLTSYPKRSLRLRKMLRKTGIDPSTPEPGIRRSRKKRG